MGQTLKRTEPGPGSRKKKENKAIHKPSQLHSAFQTLSRLVFKSGRAVGWRLGNWGAVSHTLALERQLDLWKALERGWAWEKQGYVVSAERDTSPVSKPVDSKHSLRSTLILITIPQHPVSPLYLSRTHPHLLLYFYPHSPRSGLNIPIVQMNTLSCNRETHLSRLVNVHCPGGSWVTWSGWRPFCPRKDF